MKRSVEEIRQLLTVCNDVYFMSHVFPEIAGYLTTAHSLMMHALQQLEDEKEPKADG